MTRPSIARDRTHEASASQTTKTLSEEEDAPGPLDEEELARIAREATHVGSPRHKRHPSFAGPARPRSDASICEPGIVRDEAETWLRDAIRAGAIDETEENGFARYVWYRVEGQAYEARHVRGPHGAYKGYPIEDHELPEDPEERLP